MNRKLCIINTDNLTTLKETPYDCSALIDIHKPRLIKNIEGQYTVKDSKDRLVEVNCVKDYNIVLDAIRKVPEFLVSYFYFINFQFLVILCS